jgi:phosphopantetheinyl transferase
MENISQVIGSTRLPLDLSIRPYLLDHCFEGKAVLPAVEAMQALADAVKRFRPDADLACMTEARFDKFLYIEPEASHVPALIDIAMRKNGDISATLLTRSKSKNRSMTRLREHASLCFPSRKPNFMEPPSDMISALEGVCFEIQAGALYRDLVPFGASFQNVLDPLLVSRDGAIAKVCAPEDSAGAAGILGSSFPLDAAFHAACAWAQRYTGVVAFPVGIEKRVLLRRTSPGTNYFSRILPARIEGGLLAFDIWIYDEKGELYEGACGVLMKDVSAGRMKPPQWVADEGAALPLESLKSICRGMSVVELKTVLPFAEKALSDLEKTRLERMGPSRRRSYLAARLACKRLFRNISGTDRPTPASEITTLLPDRIRPCCALGDDHPPVSCSVSHDNRFCVAAACDHPVGVDVERISERVLKSRHLYMSRSEQSLVRDAAPDELDAALRIWSVKEAVAKALAMNLAESWNRVRVNAVAPYGSRVQLDGKDFCTAAHRQVGRHLFTLVCAG